MYCVGKMLFNMLEQCVKNQFDNHLLCVREKKAKLDRAEQSHK